MFPNLGLRYQHKLEAAPSCAVARRAKLSFFGRCSAAPLLGLFSVLSVACAGTAPKGPAQKAVSSTGVVTAAERWLPLKHDTVYSYETLNESSGERGILIVQISRVRQNRVDLKMGSKIERLELLTDGVALFGTGGYLLKTPFDLGSSWHGNSGTVRVTAMDRVMQVPAGTFVGCVETTEETTTLGSAKTVVTVYCPDVGIVSLSAEARSNLTEEREVATLKSFGERVVIEDMSAE